MLNKQKLGYSKVWFFFSFQIPLLWTESLEFINFDVNVWRWLCKSLWMVPLSNLAASLCLRYVCNYFSLSRTLNSQDDLHSSITSRLAYHDYSPDFKSWSHRRGGVILVRILFSWGSPFSHYHSTIMNLLSHNAKQWSMERASCFEKFQGNLRYVHIYLIMAKTA